MVEPIAHYLIPTLILLAFVPGVDRRLVLILSPLTIAPDFDFLIGHLYLFYNLIFVVGITLLIYLFRRDGLSPLLATFFLGSHLLLDVLGPGIGLFYPFYSRLFRFDFFLYTSPATGVISYDVDLATQALTEATKDQLSPAVTAFGLVLIALILTVVLLKRRIEKPDTKTF